MYVCLYIYIYICISAYVSVCVYGAIQTPEESYGSSMEAWLQEVSLWAPAWALSFDVGIRGMGPCFDAGFEPFNIGLIGHSHSVFRAHTWRPHDLL